MAVRAKFRCETVSLEGGQAQVRFTACTHGSPENEEWSKYTPSGILYLSISSDKPAASAFVAGMEYYLDITPAK